MINLRNTTDGLEVLTATAESLDWDVSYVDYAAASSSPGAAAGNIAVATTTLILSPPGAGLVRQIKWLSLCNRGGASQTITVKKDISGADVFLTASIVLELGEYVQYTSSEGFSVLDAEGRKKLVLGPGTPGVDGPIGPLGPPGSQGDEGEQGLIGPPGSQGSTGPQGTTGSAGIAGPPGVGGADGEQGMIGPPGNKGDTGSTGAPGPFGQQGPPGYQGDEGEQGYMGPPGPAATGGSGSPGGSTGEVQYNNAGAFAGAADVEIEGGQLRLPSIAVPTAPAADGLKLFGKKRGGRMMTAQIGPSGVDTSLQPHSGTNAVSKWQPSGNSTTITAVGDAALTTTGTATAANVATTNRHTYMKRLEHLVTVAATTAVAGWRGSASKWSVGGAAAGDGGFHFTCRFGPATGVGTTTNRCFVGMSNNTAAPTDVQPSSLVNMVGVGWDAADTNMQMMHNDGAGTATKIDLGSNFPVPTTDRTKVYELALFSPPGTTQTIGYEVTDLATGNVASGTISTDMPATSSLLSPRGYMSVGGTSSVIGIALMNLYLESDY